MSSTRIVRWGALASMLGGALLITSAFDGVLSGSTPLSQLSDEIVLLLFLAGLLLAAVGLVGLHTRQVARSGLLGRVGLVLAFISIVAAFVAMVTSIIFPGDNNQNYIPLLVALLSMLLTLVPFSIVTLRAKVLPGWSAALPLVMFVVWSLALFVNPATDYPTYDPVKGGIRLTCLALFGVGWLVLGYALWKDSVQVSGSSKTAD